MKGGSNSGDPPAETMCRAIGRWVVQGDFEEGRRGGRDVDRGRGRKRPDRCYAWATRKRSFGHEKQYSLWAWQNRGWKGV